MTPPPRNSLAAALQLVAERGRQTAGWPVASASSIARAPSVAAPSPFTARTLTDDHLDCQGDGDDDAGLADAWVQRTKPELHPDALVGPIGEAVAICAPESEAAPISILLPAVTIFGAMLGRRVTQDIGGTRHFHNLFSALIGETGEGRKGSGNGIAHRFMGMVDAEFMAVNVASGLSSGEGLIGRVADPKPVDGQPPPARDTRLHIAEEEGGTVFTRMKREGNSLSGVLRQAWDCRPLSTLTRKDDGGMVARDPIISLVLQTTPDELRRGLGEIELVNGFLNRFIIAYTERVRMLPFGRPIDAGRLRGPVEQLQTVLRVIPPNALLELEWKSDAMEMYATDIYPHLKPLPGRLADVSARGAPIIRRIAGIYCVARGDMELSVSDLNAAVAIWNYSLASLRYVYGGATLSPFAQRLLDAIQNASAAGLTLTALRNAVGGNKVAKPDWDSALRELQLSRQVVADQERTTGRSKTTLRTAHAGKIRNKGEMGASEGREGLSSLVSLFPAAHAE